MYPAAFAYHAPHDLDEAVALLADHPGAAALAGGQSLIPLMRARQRRPPLVVDLRRLGLDGVRQRDGQLEIGATTTHATLEHSPLVAERCPLLAETAAVVADPLVRNLGTIGGALAHADPAGDWGATLLALDATVTVRGPTGVRSLPVAELWAGPWATVLRPGELITHVTVPLDPHSAGRYLKVRRKVGDFATVGVAVRLRVDVGGRVDHCRIGLTGVDATCVRATKAEEYLTGRRLSPRTLRRTAEIAAEQTHPVSDQRGPAEYERHLVQVLTERGLVHAATSC